VIVLHDVNIAALTGCDVDKIKTLARGENTIAKVFASTTPVTPVWIAYTSNERLFKHTLFSSGPKLSQTLLSHADDSVHKKKVSQENLEAVRARFLELNVHATPRQDQKDLDTCGSFDRDHMILGCFDRALLLLEKYEPDDFHSAHLPAYIVSALNKHLEAMESTMCCRGATTQADDTILETSLSAAAATADDAAAVADNADNADNADADAEAEAVAEAFAAPPDCPSEHRKRLALVREKFNVQLY